MLLEKSHLIRPFCEMNELDSNFTLDACAGHVIQLNRRKLTNGFGNVNVLMINI